MKMESSTEPPTMELGVQRWQEEECSVCCAYRWDPRTHPKLFLRQGLSERKGHCVLGAEARAHEWEELELLLFGVAVTGCVRQLPSPLTALYVSLCVYLPRPI